MGLKGSLKDIALENIFQMLFSERKSGLLSIQFKNRKADVYLENGKISFSKLGEAIELKRVKLLVLKNGYLTNEQWEELVSRRPVRKLEKVLTALSRRLEKDTFSFLLFRQIEYTFFTFLQWKDATYEYTPGLKPSLSKSLWKSLDGNYLLIEGLRFIEKWKDQRVKLSSPESLVFTVEDFLHSASEAKYTPSADGLYLASLASKEIRLEDLLNASKLPYHESGKILEEFMAHRLLRVKRGIEKRGEQRRTGTENSFSRKWVEGGALLILVFVFIQLIAPDFLKHTLKRLTERSREEKRIVPGQEQKLPEKAGVLDEAGSAPKEGNEGTKPGATLPPRQAPEPTHAQETSVHPRQPQGQENNEDWTERETALHELRQLERSAEAGDVDAQLALGFLYDFGSGFVSEDDEKASFWYRKAAEEGALVEAQFNLGVMYKKGEGVPQDSLKALMWYSKAAAQGYPQAQYNLGLLYLAGDGVDTDEQTALGWLYKSGLSFLEKGDNEAVQMVIHVIKKIDPEHPGGKKLLEFMGEESDE